MATFPIDVIAQGDCTPASARRLIHAYLAEHPDGWPKVYSVLRAFTWKMLAERRADKSLKLWRQLIEKTAAACPDPKHKNYMLAMADMFEMSRTHAKTGLAVVER